ENTQLTILPATLLGNDSDADGDSLTITSVQNASHGSVQLVGGNVVFTPTNGYTGNASFTYTISDGHGGTSTASVTVNVTNNPPAANPDAIITNVSDFVIQDVWLLANDTDAETPNSLSVTG